MKTRGALITFDRQRRGASLVAGEADIFSTILHVQLVYAQCVSGGSVFDTVLLPGSEHCRALSPGYCAVWLRRFTGQDGFFSFKDLLIFQLFLEEYWGNCQVMITENKAVIYTHNYVIFMASAALMQNEYFRLNVEETTGS